MNGFLKILHSYFGQLLFIVLISSVYSEPKAQQIFILPGGTIELDYTGFKSILVDKNQKWEIDVAGSKGLGKFFRLEDDQGQTVYRYNGRSRYRLVPLVNTPFNGTLYLQKINNSPNSVKRGEVWNVSLPAPYLRIFSPLAQNPQKEVSDNNPIEIKEQTDPNLFFLQIPLYIESNVIFNAKLEFSKNIKPWAFFQLSSNQVVKKIFNNRINTKINVDNLNYSTNDDEVGLTFYSTDDRAGAQNPNLSIKTKIIRKHLNVKITGVKNTSGGFQYKKANTTLGIDTIFVPYYKAATDFDVEGNVTWGVFNEVDLMNKYNFKLTEYPNNNKLGKIEVLQDNFQRNNKIITPLLLFHKNGIKSSPILPWKVAVIVQNPGYIDVSKQEVRELNPAPGSIKIAVESNLQWNASLEAFANEDISWIDLEQSEYSNDQELKLRINSYNYTGKDRRVKILLKAKNGHGPNREIIFIHSSAYIRIVEPKQVIFPEQAHDPIWVKVEANIPWTVSLPKEVDDWLKITKISADGFFLKAKDNNSGKVRYSGIILQSQDGNFPVDKTPADSQFVQQILSMISLQVSPFPRMIFLAPENQNQVLKIITMGGWSIEKLPQNDYSWLRFPQNLFGNGNSELIFTTTKANNGKEIRQAKIRVKSQLENLGYYDIEILQIPEQFISVNTLVKDYLRVTFSAFEPGYKARLFSEFGVMSQEIIFKGVQELVDVSILPTGNYLLYFYDKNGMVIDVKKIVKM